MDKLAALLLSVFLPVFVSANLPDSCSIFLNKKVVYYSAVEQPNPVVMVKRAGLKKRDCISISYSKESADTGWNRTFYLNDSVGNEIKMMRLNEPEGCVSVKASVLTKMMDIKQPVFIYTQSLPKDPEVAKRVRVRRLLLCRIEWN